MSTELQEKPKQATSGMTIRKLLKNESMIAEIGRALPKHCDADRMARITLTAITRTPLLAECDEASFFAALLTLSQWGLEPDGRRAHLIPFKNNKRGCYECQLIIDYKGLVELAYRSGYVASIHADVVCENDDFEVDMGEVTRHRIDYRLPRGKPFAAYCIVKLKDGAKKTEVLSLEEIEGIRKRSRAGNAGPWVTDWNEMAKKTAFRRVSKWIPLSAEIRDAYEHDHDTIVESGQAAPSSSIDDITALLSSPAEREPGDEPQA